MVCASAGTFCMLGKPGLGPLTMFTIFVIRIGYRVSSCFPKLRCSRAGQHGEKIVANATCTGTYLVGQLASLPRTGECDEMQ